MSSEWPIRSEAPAPAPLESCILERPDTPATRLAAVAADLFVPASHRMSDRVRAYMSTMLDSVAGTFECDLRLLLQPSFADRPQLIASLASRSVEIALPLLHDARTLAHPPLIRVVLRRAEEFVLSRRIAPRVNDAGPLADDPDSDIAAAALALAIADARRIDRFGAPALLPDDLPADVAHWLVWHVAAALRLYLCAHHDIAHVEADAALTQGVARLLARHDEGAGFRPACARLALLFASKNRLDGALLRILLESGQLGAFTASLAVAAGLPDEEAWNIVADPGNGRLAIVLRAADTDRDAAAGILLALAADPVAEIDLFDNCDRVAALRTIARLALPRTYRDATQALDAALANRDARA